MQSKSSQKVITGNQKNVTSISQKFSKIKGIRYVKREKMNFRFSHPLLLKSRKCLITQHFRLFVLYSRVYWCIIKGNFRKEEFEK